MGSLLPQIRIALLDDHAIVRYGIASRLSSEPDILLVGNYESSREMIAGLRIVPADVLLVDYALGPSEIDGASLIRELKHKFPRSRVLILSSHDDPATVALALRAGARGFIGKRQAVAQVTKAIRAVAAGSIYLDPDMSYRLAEISTSPLPELSAQCEVDDARLFAGARLSTKEREVIRCFLDGLTVSQIAEKFGRSAKTISTQKSMAFRKLGVNSDNGLFKIKSMLNER